MRRFAIDCKLEYDVGSPTHFLFHIEASRIDGQHVLKESLYLQPQLTPVHFEQPSGNRFFRLDPPAGPLSVRYTATVERDAQPVPDYDATEALVRDLPAELLHMLSPTRYCESDLLGPAAMKLFGDLPQGHSRVEAIARWIHDSIEYRVGSTTTTTTARDVFVQRSGVCRDFAHLGVAFCRALSIPARFVVGYAQFAKPPPDFHAVFEAYVGGRWIPFDATGLAPVDTFIRIGIGSDAKDVAFATNYGPARLTAVSPEITEVPA
jgi:transglutaminase-like putative cysteine protease